MRLSSVASLTVLALCACTHVEPKVPRDGAPVRTSGYVGGVFAKTTRQGFGFRLENEQSKETYVMEIDDDAMSLIAVPPGRYHVQSWVTWAGAERKITTEDAFAEDQPIRRSFAVQPGQVMLLGEWHADFDREDHAFSLMPVEMTEPTALRMLREAYPGFADVRAQCLHCSQ